MVAPAAFPQLLLFLSISHPTQSTSASSSTQSPHKSVLRIRRAVQVGSYQMLIAVAYVNQSLLRTRCWLPSSSYAKPSLQTQYPTILRHALPMQPTSLPPQIAVYHLYQHRKRYRKASLCHGLFHQQHLHQNLLPWAKQGSALAHR
jgi:hypothetical protein